MKRLLSLALGVLLFTASAVYGAEISVSPAPHALKAAIKSAQAGDILRLSPGLYAGPILIDKPLVLTGLAGQVEQTEIRGNEQGSVISVIASGVTISNLTITGSGSSGADRDSAVMVGKGTRNVQVLGNRLLGNLVGVDLRGAKDALVEGNLIEGRRDHRMNARGNGVYVWNAPGSVVRGNDFRWGRDGIFVNASKRNEFSGNRFRELRFAVHYMYANDSVVKGNISIGNHLGYAIMHSDRVEVTGNLSLGDRDHGIMLNYTNRSLFKDNIVEDTKGKCTFVYNSHRNDFDGNIFKGCNIGIHFTAGSERNDLSGNSFIGNRTQVKYVGTRWLDWSASGKGNYWSDNAGFDLDGDGIADGTYRPNDMMDKLLWSQPAARELLGSPAVQLIRWSQSTFPALLPGGVIDSAPLMQPLMPERPVWHDLPLLKGTK